MTRGVGGKSYQTIALSICETCLQWEANGECGGDDGASYAAGVERETFGGAGHVSLGWTREEHAIHKRARTGVESDDLGFSWSPCDLCGCKLGGERYAATLWLPRFQERHADGRFGKAWTVGASWPVERDCGPSCLGCSRGTSKGDPRVCSYDRILDYQANLDEEAAARADARYDAGKDARLER